MLRPAQDRDVATDGGKRTTQRKPKTKATTNTYETEERVVVDGIAPESPIAISSLPTQTTALENKTAQSRSSEDDSSGACNKENVV